MSINLTEKQRLEAYKYALEFLLNPEIDKAEKYLCSPLRQHIHDTTGRYLTYIETVLSLPEFKLFDPEYRGYSTWFWQGTIDEAIQERINCMLFCIEMLESSLNPPI